jgi:type I restriction enzyme M protein
MTAVERVRVDSETNLRTYDKVHQLHTDHVDDTHFHASQVYEDLLLKMGENSDGGQFLPK